MQEKVGVPSITVRLRTLLQLKLGLGSISLEADNVREALDRLEERIGPQFREQFKGLHITRRYVNGGVVDGDHTVEGRIEDNCALLLDGHSIDRKNLRQIKLRADSVLDILPPGAGG